MAEVEEGQVEKVDNEENFTLPEEASDPEKDETEAEEVVLENMVRTLVHGGMSRHRMGKPTRIK